MSRPVGLSAWEQLSRGAEHGPLRQQGGTSELMGGNQAAVLELPWSPWFRTGLGQQFLSGVPQEFLKFATPDSVVRSTDLFSLILSKK